MLKCRFDSCCHPSPFFVHKQGFNPMIHFTFSPTSNHTEIYQTTQEGFLIARTNQLQPKQKHILEVSLREKPVLLFDLIKNTILAIFHILNHHKL